MCGSNLIINIICGELYNKKKNTGNYVIYHCNSFKGTFYSIYAVIHSVLISPRNNRLC